MKNSISAVADTLRGVFSIKFWYILSTTKAGFQADARMKALLADQIEAHENLANQEAGSKHQFENLFKWPDARCMKSNRGTRYNNLKLRLKDSLLALLYKELLLSHNFSPTNFVLFSFLFQ